MKKEKAETIQPIVDSYLLQLGTKLRLKDAVLNADGEVLINCSTQNVNLSVHILVREQDSLVAIVSPIAPIPSDDRFQELFAALMSANLFGVGAKGLTFSASPKDGQIYLGYCLLHPGLSYEAFETAFSRVVAMSAYWKARVEKLFEQR